MSSPTPPYASRTTATATQLFEAWQHDRDEVARDELIERYLPLARKLASRYARSNEPFEDLVQVASVGLIKAVERFDPSHGAAFTSFAVPTIVGELKRHFRDSSWTLQVDRRSQERARAVLSAQQAIAATGKSPTVLDLAQFLECDTEDVLEGLQASQAYSAVSLDAPASAGEAAGADGATLADVLGGADLKLDLADDRATLDAALRHLPKLERRVLYLRFDQDLNQREIADMVGVSQMHVSRLLRGALIRLREQLEGGPGAQPS